jgi:hypothetical protein
MSCASRHGCHPTQSISASRPCLAAQKFFAITATPPGTCTTLTTPGTALAAVASKLLTRGAELRGTLQQRDQHAGQREIQGELRRAVALRARIHTRDLVANQLEIFRILELDLVGNGKRCRFRDQRAERRLTLAGCVRDDALVHREFFHRHVPLRGRGADQHRSRLAAGIAQLRPGIGHRRAAAGALKTTDDGVAIALGIRWRTFDAHQRPVSIQFFRQHGRDSGIGALTHLHVLGDDRHAVVGTDAKERVRCKRGCGVGRGDRGRCAARMAHPFKPDCERGGSDRTGLFEKSASRGL